MVSNSCSTIAFFCFLGITWHCINFLCMGYTPSVSLY
jgi:hypothetical protein